MKKVNSFAIGLASCFVPSLGYFMMGKKAKAIVLLCVVIGAIVGAPSLLILIMPFSGLLQLNEAFVYNRAINDSKTDRLLELLDRRSRE